MSIQLHKINTNSKACPCADLSAPQDIIHLNKSQKNMLNPTEQQQERSTQTNLKQNKDHFSSEITFPACLPYSAFSSPSAVKEL